MKALTVNRMAAARLRANRKAYISLIVGIFLSVFLVTTLVLCIQGVILAQMEQTNRSLGFEDAFLLDTPELTDGDVAGMEYFDAIGHVYVTTGIQDTDICLGWYDETGAALLSRQTRNGCNQNAPQRQPPRSRNGAGRLIAAANQSDKLVSRLSG